MLLKAINPVVLILSLKLVTALEPSRPYPPKYGSFVSSINRCEKLNVVDTHPNEYHLFQTSLTNLAFSHVTGSWSSSRKYDDSFVTYLEINRRNPYQSSNFIGFGCDFTDSDLAILNRMPSNQRESLFRSYFSADGLGFDLLRVTAGSFGHNSNFERKLALKRQIEKMLNKQLKVAAEFQIPSVKSGEVGNLRDSLEKLANSFRRNQIWVVFLDSIRSTPSEDATDQGNHINQLIANLNTTEGPKPKFCLIDNTKSIEFPWLTQFETGQNRILDKIDMICLTNDSVAPELMCRAYKQYEKPILFKKSADSVNSIESTESWLEAQKLINTLMSLLHHNIDAYFENSFISYTNLTLLSIDKQFSNVQKQPAFYAMAHFSRYILPGSVRVDGIFCGLMSSDIQTVAYVRPDEMVTVILYNSAEHPIQICVIDREIGEFTVTLMPKSINTIVYSIQMHEIKID